MIAQAILESSSGSSQLAQEPYNNLFGIKGEYKGQSVTFLTFEDDGSGNYYQINSVFCQYPSAKESFEDYSTLLTDGVEWNPTIYKGAWKDVAKTYQNATQALTGVYATDTLYNQKLNGLIETYNLTQYDHEKGEIGTGGDFEPYNNVNYDEGNSYAPLNCTQYAYNRITQLGGYVDLDMGNGADWGATGATRGYEVSNTPKAGTAVSFAPGVLGADPIYGHVAFLEKVNEDGSILISEMNAVGLGVVSTRTISAEYVGMLMYITPK
ncbi:glucosaminidase domain-containing protein [Enterococcus termitis]